MGRVEILTGHERRRRWTDEQKLTILAEVAEGDLSVTDVARRHDLIPQQIYGWRRKFARQAEAGRQAETATFLPVAVVPSTEPEQPAEKEETAKSLRRSASVEVRCRGGRVLKVAAGLDPALLQALIRAVEAA